MPQPTKGPRLGAGPAHQRLMLANLATSLFEHGSITTTEAKAKRLRPLAEPLITFAKRGDLHNRRQVLSVIRDKSVVHVLFTEIGPRYAERPGGYTRITKIGPRKGDNAPMAVIELVEAQFTPKVRATRPAATGAKPEPETPAAEGPYGTGSATAMDSGEAPEGYPIKGNENSKKFHRPEGQWYDQTDADVWFATPEDAEAAGFVEAGASTDED